MKLYHNRVITCFSLLLTVIFVTTACTLKAPRVNSSGQPQREYTYQIPEKITAGWEVSSLEEEGIDTVRINELMSNILLGNFPKIHSVLLVKNGKLVLEEYFYDYNRERLHQIRSATKSIGSVLTGIAIDQGFIKNENERIYQHFKSYEPKEGWDERVRDVTLKSLMTMTSGYGCDDHKGNFNCERNMYKSDDWLEYALNLPMVYNPGDHWAYNSASLWLVGEVISKKSHMSIPDFADKYLFEPLAITNFQWGFSQKGRAWLAGNAEMRPRDMAKFGCVVLNKGKWKGTQIVSKEWIEKSTKAHVRVGGYEYGYLWWLGKLVKENQIVRAIIAAGHGGQRICVFPTLDLVAVFTSQPDNNPGGHAQIAKMLLNFILPAMPPPDSTQKIVKLNPQIIDNYLGVYEQKEMKVKLSIFKKENKIYGKTSIFDQFELYPYTENKFSGISSKVGNFLIDIIKEKNGKVKLMTVYFGFVSYNFDKIK